MLKILLVTIKLYQRWISPFLGPHCRFYPSCSQYTYEALEKYGFFKGTILSFKRVLKCHPMHPGGIDHVP